MLKPSIQLRLGQSLTMTPQLQQAIRLLQLSTLELQTQIQEALEENPMLELADEAEDFDDLGSPEEGEDLPVADLSPTQTQEAPGADDYYDPGPTAAAENIPEELPVDSAWEDIYDLPAMGTGSAEGDDRDPFENQTGADESLQEHLLWQINLTPMSEQDRAIAIAIIDSINEDGYLGDEIEVIHAGLLPDLDVDLDEVQAVLHFIQHLDPISVAARDLAECLDIQLGTLDPETPHLATARRLVREHLDLLAARDWRQMSRALGVSEDDIHTVDFLIHTLNPRPGAVLGGTTSEYIVPDVFVRRHQNRWLVELNPDIAPRLRVNPLYASFVRRADTSSDNTYMRNHLQEARWFIKSLKSRNETLLKVATAIVERQRGFLEYGEEAMKPLVLRDIAEQLEMHESTISRVTTQKYMFTPRGIFEFKFFFSSHVSTSDGGECSATAIRAMLRKLISEEPADKPMSDSRIAELLLGRGINVARRTIAKYREAMSIPPSNERRRHA